MTGNRRVGVLIAVIVIGCVAVAALTRPAPTSLMDLDSTAPDGANALRLLLEHDGSTVESADASVVDGAATDRFDTVFIPDAHGASDAQIARWHSYADAGGHLVLGSAVPGLGAVSASDEPTGDEAFVPALDLSGRDQGTCTMPALADLTELTGISAGIKITGPADYLIVAGENRSCFGTARQALVVLESETGVVNIGVPTMFDNRSMGAPEVGTTTTDVRANAAVASALLAPTGPARVAVINTGISRIVGEGGNSPFDLLRPGVRAGLWELTIAVAFFAWWQGRRHGRVVREPTPTHLAASELVDAVGNLLQRQGDAANAAEVIRRSVARDLTLRLGLAPSPDAESFARTLAPRSNRSPEELMAMFAGPVADDAALEGVTRQLESLRQEVLHV